MDTSIRLNRDYMYAQIGEITATKESIRTNTELDIINPLRKKAVSVLAGLSCEGISKLAIALTLLLAKNDYEVLYVTEDTTKNVLAERMLLSWARVEEDAINSGISSQEWGNIVDAANNQTMEKISIDDSGMYIPKLDRILQAHSYDIVIIDSINNFQQERGLGVRANASYIASRIEDLAKKYNVAFLLLHHLPSGICSKNSGAIPLGSDVCWIRYGCISTVASLYHPYRHGMSNDESTCYLYFDKYPDFYEVSKRITFQINYDKKENRFNSLRQIR